MKYPLNIYIVWHPDSLVGEAIAKELYNTFCRDYKTPLSRGLGIPVYFRSAKLDNNKPVAVDFSGAEKNAVICLIDDVYFLDDYFKQFTSEIVGKLDDNNRIYPIKLFEKAHSIGCGLSNLQFVDAMVFFKDKLDFQREEDLSKAIKKIKSEVLHDCARLLMEYHPIFKDKEKHRIGSPVKLFLSHAKYDGQSTTIKFKQFIENNLKLDVFFDTVDIANGYDFAKQFEQEILNSALVVFHTDEYSNREWCRREVLIAKRHKSPIVVVHKITEGEKRAFPYLGNVPTTVLNDNDEELSFYNIVYLTLYQVLNNLYQYRLLSNHKVLKDIDAEIKVITSPPELFNFVDIKAYQKEIDKKLIILYPDPPLGLEELSILNEVDSDVEFITPINLH
ncbi:toll/interleukin-1 receptor domain-containing protein [Pedobacter riviphilus]|uniref:Toll/interleukin-1 receptor domain-containing protein n=1 Tax=Pedobacter riviphilus TaxID=2766984 RepID=A0ABX6TL01_9SPHI|nr:toll/interleukin-1 receptor domain-containing protein [Pedobacter riviphilus]QNR85881.1 toll/interleukin-1 receptor domain-containing protein [Pedobacter riviphilus]